MFCRGPQVTSLLIVKPIPLPRAQCRSCPDMKREGCDKLSAVGFHLRDALEPGQEMQSRDGKREHEPDRILPFQQEGLGCPEIQAEQPYGQEQLAQRIAAVVSLGRLEIAEWRENEDQDDEQQAWQADGDG